MNREMFWNKVYDVLVEECGANEGGYGRREFVLQQLDEHFPREWRFCGNLGFGGKFYRDDGMLCVKCYREDETPERKKSIDVANKRMAVLGEEMKGIQE